MQDGKYLAIAKEDLELSDGVSTWTKGESYPCRIQNDKLYLTDNESGETSYTDNAYRTMCENRIFEFMGVKKELL